MPGSPTPPANGWRSCRPVSARPIRDGWPCASGRKGLNRRRWSRQFELFKIAEGEKRDKVLRQARFLRFVGTFIAIVLFASVFLLLLWVFKQSTR